MLRKILIFGVLAFCPLFVCALVLEDIAKDDLRTILAGKKVGYYIGSFDPIHKGHEGVVTKVLAEKLVDYVLIYPAWGGDKYKNRIDVKIRLAMLFSLYKDNPKVFVTRLAPQQLQNLLTEDDAAEMSGRPTVRSVISNVEYIGIIGSDSALEGAKDEKWLTVFMRGIKIPAKYENNTIGGIIALPVVSFIVVVRQGDNLAPLQGKLLDRKITAIPSPFQDLSSTKARGMIKNNIAVNAMLSSQIIDIISSNNLYR